jgi:hypothetical protein
VYKPKGDNMKQKKIYAVQYGAFWRLTPEQAIEVLQSLKNGGSYDLSPYKRLKNMPKTVYRDTCDERERFGSSYSSTFVFEPLDYDELDATYTLGSLKEFLQ